MRGFWGFGGSCPPRVPPARWAAPPGYEGLWGVLGGSLTSPVPPSSVGSSPPGCSESFRRASVSPSRASWARSFCGRGEGDPRCVSTCHVYCPPIPSVPSSSPWLHLRVPASVCPPIPMSICPHPHVPVSVCLTISFFVCVHLCPPVSPCCRVPVAVTAAMCLSIPVSLSLILCPLVHVSLCLSRCPFVVSYLCPCP